MGSIWVILDGEMAWGMERSGELIQSVSSSSGIGIILCTWLWGGHIWVLGKDEICKWSTLGPGPHGARAGAQASFQGNRKWWVFF